MCMEYPEVGVEEGYGSGPTPSTSIKMASDKSSNKKRGQHGRHKVHRKVHAIHKIGLLVVDFDDFYYQHFSRIHAI